MIGGPSQSGSGPPSRMGATELTESSRSRTSQRMSYARATVWIVSSGSFDQHDPAVARPVLGARGVDRHDPVARPGRRRRRARRRPPGAGRCGPSTWRGPRATPRIATPIAKAIVAPPKTRSAVVLVPRRPTRGHPADGDDDALERQDVAVRRERDGRVDERPAGHVDRGDERREREQDRGVDEERAEVDRPAPRPAADDHRRGEDEAADQGHDR